MDRRTFLKTAAAGALGFSALGRPVAWGREPGAAPALPAAWTWARIQPEWDATRQAAFFAEAKDAGIDAVLLGGTFDDAVLQQARAHGIAVHHWRWTLCRAGDLLEKHPDWYVVTREGVSLAEKPMYVPYYRFLCPTREEVVEHLVHDYAEAASRDGVAGVHLDYVRYPDVILPKALWAKYGLVQHEELPPYDTCYCEVCRKTFAKEAGVDPLALADPPADEAWRRFRQERVTRLVNRIAQAVRARGKAVSAAVFPTPAIARRLVRQDWPAWDLDAVFPMTYQSFYEEPVAWIETAVREGVTALSGRRPLFPGLYLPALQGDGAFAEAMARARAGGAAGVALFGGLRPIPAAGEPSAPTPR